MKKGPTFLQRCWALAASLESRLPVVLDLVEDRTKHRAFTLSLYALVLIFVIRSAVFILFLNRTNFVSGALPSPVIALLKPLPRQIEIGLTVRPLLTLGARSPEDGKPLQSYRLEVDFRLESPEELLLSKKWGYENTAYDESGLLLGGVFSLPGFPPRILQQPKLEGNITSTDDVGSATFRGLRILTALPGSYLVYAHAPDFNISTLLGRVLLTSSVSTVTLNPPSTEAASLHVPLGVPLPPFSVKILDSKGSPLAGKTAVLFPSPPEVSEFSTLIASPDILQPRAAMVGEGTSSPSGIDGLAWFRNVSIVASSLRRVRLWASVDGVVASVAGGAGGAGDDRSLSITVDTDDFYRSSVPRGKRGFVMTLVAPPSTSVTEGLPFPMQPVVKVERRVSGGGLEPAVGVTVFAFPVEQPGGFHNSRNPLAPTGMAELGVLVGTPNAVEANLGRVKGVFKGASAPSDAQGLARWSGLGFIRHGPAGRYTLGFGAAGVSSLETPPINVLSSVTNVTWVSSWAYSHNMEMCYDEWDHYTGTVHPRFDAQTNPTAPLCDYAATLCNWPTCVSRYGTPAGFVVYQEEEQFEEVVNDAADNIIPNRLRKAPSGVLSASTTLVVTNALGQPLAGKTAVPSLTPLGGGGVAEIAEMPFAGASVSKLNLPAFITASSEQEAQGILEESKQKQVFSPPSTVSSPYPGGITFHQKNTPFTPDVRSAYEKEVNDPSSFLRVVSSPPGESSHELTFTVEGVVAIPAKPIVGDVGVPFPHPLIVRVTNLDTRTSTFPVVSALPGWAPPAPNLCAHLRILQVPNTVVQDGSTVGVLTSFKPTTPMPFRAPSPLGGGVGAPTPFRVQAINSFGQPLSGVSVAMFVVDVLGYAMYTTIGGDHLGLRGEYASFLRATGGVAAHTIGNSTSSFLGNLLHGPAALATTGPDGIAVFPNITLRRAQNTWVKLGFAALYKSITAQSYEEMENSTISDFLDGPAGCVSEYSPPVIIESTVEECEWADATTALPLSDAALESYALRVNDNITSPASPIFSKPLPPLIVKGPRGNTPPTVLFSIIDQDFSSFPSHVGIHTFEFEPFPPNYNNNWARGQRVGITPASWDLAVFRSDGIQVGNLMPAVPAVLGAVNVAILVGAASSQGYSYAYSSSTTPPGASPFLETYLADTFTPGYAGNYSLVSLCGGEVSQPLLLTATDPIDTVVAGEWSPSDGACPGDHTASNSLGTQYFLPAQPDPCPNNCTGHGICQCGVCVCASGWDGAIDCSLQFMDVWAQHFSLDPLYAKLYGGLPVYDVRRGMELGGASFYFGDVFPRFLLPSRVTVGTAKASPAASVAASLRAYSVDLSLNTSASSTGFFDIDPAIRVLDAADLIRKASLGLESSTSAFIALDLLNGGGNSFDVSMLSVTMPVNKTVTPLNPFYRTQPVLMTCSGKPVTGWSFVSGLSACPSDVVPVSSVVGFERYKADFTTSEDDSSDESAWFSQRRYDQRLHLYGVPTGCYRFKFVYGSQGVGNRVLRSISDPLGTSQGSNLGFGRPFRVISPVTNIIELPPVWKKEVRPLLNLNNVTLTRGSPLPFSLRVRLQVRPRVANDSSLSSLSDSQLLDGCSDGFNFDAYFFDPGTQAKRYVDLPSKAGSSRCPTEPKGGLEVTISAVSFSTGLEYSLYLPGSTVDCARTEYSVSGRQEIYNAVFSSDLQFPLVPTLPPTGVRTGLALMAPAGEYYFRYYAYGTTLNSQLIRVTLVDLPSQVVNLLDLRALVDPTPVIAPSHPYLPLLFYAPPDFSGNISYPVAVPVNVGGDFLSSGINDRPLLVGSALFDVARVASLNSSAFEATWFPKSVLANSPQARLLDRQVISFLSPILSLVGPVLGWTPVTGPLVTSEILYGPPHANARFRLNTVSTQPGGVAISDFSLLTASSGLYIVRQSTSLLVKAENLMDTSDAIVLLNVTNPVGSVSAKVNKGSGKLISGSPLAGTVKICATMSGGGTDSGTGTTSSSLAGLNLTLRFVSPPAPPTSSTFLDAAASLTAPYWLKAVRGASNHPMVRLGEDDYSDVSVGASASSLDAKGRLSLGAGSLGIVGSGSSSLPPMSPILGSDGCVTVNGLKFNVPQSTTFALVASVLGVESPPALISVTSLADANPVTLKKIKERIATPLFAIIPLLAFNSASAPTLLRFAAAAGAIVSIVVMGVNDGASFLEDTGGFLEVYLRGDVSYVEALDIMWWAILGFNALLLGVLLVGMVPEVVARVGAALGRGSGGGGGGAIRVLQWCWRGQRRSFRKANASKLEDFSSFKEASAFTYVKTRLPKLFPSTQQQELLLHHQHDEGKHHHYHHHHHHHHHHGGHDSHGGHKDHTTSNPSGLYEGLWKPYLASLREGLHQGSLTLHSCVFMEDPGVAFFFPQRILVAAIVSAVFSALVVMLALYWSLRAEEALSGLLVYASDLASRALTSYIFSKARGGDAQVNAVSATLAWIVSLGDGGAGGGVGYAECAERLSSVVSAAQDAAAATSATSAFVSTLPLPPSLLSVISTSSSTSTLGSTDPFSVEATILSLRAAIFDSFQDFVDPTARYIRGASIAGCTLALVCVTLSWWRILYTYKELILKLRVGKGREGTGLGPSQHSEPEAPSKAVGFVGVQAATTALTALITSLVFTTVFFLLSLPYVHSKLVNFLNDFLLWLMGTAFLLRVLKFVLFELTLDGDGAIVFRRGFASLDLYFGFLSIISGFILAFARLVYCTFIFLGSIMRPDVSLSSLSIRLDPGRKTYAAMVAMDARFSNPIHVVVVRMFKASLVEVREAGVKRAGGKTAVDHSTVAWGEQNDTLAGSGTPTTTTTTAGGGGGAGAADGAAEVAVVVSNPLVSGGGKEDAHTPHYPPGSPMDEERRRLRRLIARNRWWLACFLLANPEMAKYRVRDMHLEHPPHAHSLLEHTHHILAGVLC